MIFPIIKKQPFREFIKTFHLEMKRHALEWKGLSHSFWVSYLQNLHVQKRKKMTWEKRKLEEITVNTHRNTTSWPVDRLRGWALTALVKNSVLSTHVAAQNCLECQFLGASLWPLWKVMWRKVWRQSESKHPGCWSAPSPYCSILYRETLHASLKHGRVLQRAVSGAMGSGETLGSTFPLPGPPHSSSCGRHTRTSGGDSTSSLWAPTATLCTLTSF